MRVFRSSWEHEALKHLHSDVAKRFPRVADLRQVYDEARDGAKVPRVEDEHRDQTTFAKWVNSLIRRGHVMRIQRDLYANISVSYIPDSIEAAHLLRPSAVVSLISVLGNSGTRNNHTPEIYSIIRSDSSDATRPREVKIDLVSQAKDGRPWEFRFISMSPKLYFAGEENDRLDQDYDYPRATAERAFCDLLLVDANPKIKLRSDWAWEADLSDLDQDRLARLIAAMGIGDLYESFLARVPEEEDESYSHGMQL